MHKVKKEQEYQRSAKFLVGIFHKNKLNLIIMRQSASWLKTDIWKQKKIDKFYRKEIEKNGHNRNIERTGRK